MTILQIKLNSGKVLELTLSELEELKTFLTPLKEIPFGRYTIGEIDLTIPCTSLGKETSKAGQGYVQKRGEGHPQVESEVIDNKTTSSHAY